MFFNEIRRIFQSLFEEKKKMKGILLRFMLEVQAVNDEAV